MCYKIQNFSGNRLKSCISSFKEYLLLSTTPLKGCYRPFSNHLSKSKIKLHDSKKKTKEKKIKNFRPKKCKKQIFLAFFRITSKLAFDKR